MIIVIGFVTVNTGYSLMFCEEERDTAKYLTFKFVESLVWLVTYQGVLFGTHYVIRAVRHCLCRSTKR